MTDIVNILFKADSSEVKGASKDVKDLKKNSDSAEGSTKKLAAGFKKAALAAAALAAAVKAVDVLAKMGAEAIKTADSLGKTAAKLGLTAEELQELRILADAAGVSTSSLDVGFQRFTRRLDQARAGTGKLNDRFTELGISLKDQNGRFKSNIEVFQEFGNKVGEIEDASRAIATTFDAVDTEGVNMINMFRTSREEQEKLIETAKSYGAVLSNEVVANAEAYATQLGLVEQATQRLQTQQALVLAPLTLAWAELKNQAAQYTAEVLVAIGIMDKNIPILEGKLARVRRELKEMTERSRTAGLGIDTVGAAAPGEESARASFQAGMQQNIIEKLQEIAQIERELEALRAPARAAQADADARRAELLEQQAQAQEELRKKLEAEAEARVAAADAASQQEAAARKLKSEQESEQKRLDALAEKYHAMIDPMYTYNKQVDELNRLLATGRINAEGYAEALKLLDPNNQEGDDPWQALIDKSLEINNQLARMKVEGIEGLADSIADFAVTGKQSFNEFAADFLRQIARMIIKALIFKAIMSALGLNTAGGGSSTPIPQGGTGAGMGSFNGPTGMADTGGTVKAGQPVMIGTGAQPEMFIPRTAGTMIPAGMQGGGVNIGAVNVTVQGKEGETSEEQAARIGRAIREEMRGLVINELGNQSRKGNMLNPAPVKAFR